MSPSSQEAPILEPSLVAGGMRNGAAQLHLPSYANKYLFPLWGEAAGGLAWLVLVCPREGHPDTVVLLA